MAQFELVWIPFIIALLFFLLGCLVLLWHKARLKKANHRLPGSSNVLVLGISLIAIGGVSLFIGLFFLITG